MSLLLGRLNGQRESFRGRYHLQRATALLHERPAFLRPLVQLVVAPPRFVVKEYQRLRTRRQRQLDPLRVRRMSPAAMMIVLFGRVRRVVHQHLRSPAEFYERIVPPRGRAELLGGGA